MAETKARFLANIIGATSTDNDFTLPNTAVSGTNNKVLTSGGDGTVTWETTVTAPTITSVTTPASDNSINVDDNVVMTVTGTKFANTGMTAKLVDASNETSVVTGHDTSDLSISYTNTTSISVTTRAATANISQSNVKLVITKSGLSATSASIGVSPDPTFTALTLNSDNAHATLIDNLGSGQNVGSAISASASDGASITYSISGATSAGNTYIINSTSGQITTPSAGIADVSSGSSYSESPVVTATAGGDSTRTHTLSVPLLINKYVPTLFSGYAYSGSSSDQNIFLTSLDNSVDSKPDLVWIKERSASQDHYLFDTIRGHSNFLSSNDNGAEDTDTTSLTGFLDDGFSLDGGDGKTNESGQTYVAWAFQSGGAPTATNSGGQSPTSGSVMIDGSASTANLASASIYPNKMSVNTDGGFSIVTYDGVRSSAGSDTIPHGLGSAPDLIIIKQFSSGDTFDWSVGHSSSNLQASSGFLKLNTGDALDSNWNDFGASPDANVFTTQYSGRVNASGREYVAYCWKAVSGVSAFGSYTGTGGALSVTDQSGATNCGFNPRFLMIKNISTANNGWIIWDTFRGIESRLFAHDSAYEETDSGTQTHYPTIASNGFSYPSTVTHDNFNKSGDTYIYMAFA